MKFIRYLEVSAFAVLLAFTVMSATPEAAHADETTINGLDRVACWPWMGQCSFRKGEAVVGVDISIGGYHYPFCFFRSAPADGIVRDGAINYWPSDETRDPNLRGPCQQPTETTPTPPPPTPTRQWFSAGQSVLGGTIVLSTGQVFHGCYIGSIGNHGYVDFGFVNPPNFYGAYNTCPGYSRSAPYPLTKTYFPANTPVMGGWIYVDNVYVGYSCFIISRGSGYVEGGWVWPQLTPGVKIRVCGSPESND